jgi:uncharacterized membrane protein YciS (DUF1049 family)
MTADEIEEKKLTKLSKGYPWITWLMALLLIIIGVYLTKVGFLGLEWLSRSGCLIVLLGVWSGLGGIIQERLILGKFNVRHKISLAHLKRRLRKSKASAEHIEKEVQTIEDEFEDKIAVLMQTVRLQLGMLEVSLLMTGTLLWGFGDLFFLTY